MLGRSSRAEEEKAAEIVKAQKTPAAKTLREIFTGSMSIMPQIYRMGLEGSREDLQGLPRGALSVDSHSFCDGLSEGRTERRHAARASTHLCFTLGDERGRAADYPRAWRRGDVDHGAALWASERRAQKKAIEKIARKSESENGVIIPSAFHSKRKVTAS